MIEDIEIQKNLEEALPDALIRVIDLTGTKDHYEVRVASKEFEGLSLIDQHQKVQNPLLHMINDGRIHALSIKTSSNV